MELTDKEKAVYNAIVDVCTSDCEASPQDIAQATGFKNSTIAGVLGSLTKKNLISCETEVRCGKKFIGACPVINGEISSFLCDKLDDEEIESLKVK